MQGTIKSNVITPISTTASQVTQAASQAAVAESSAITSDIEKIVTTTSSFRKFLATDFKTNNKFNNYYGPMLSIFVITVVLKILGLISSCLSCWPIRVIFEAFIVFLLTLMMLTKKCSQYCKKTRDLAAFAVMPTIVFTGIFVIIGFLLMWLPLVGDVIAALIATVVFAIAVSYSQYLCIVRSCQNSDKKTFWTFFA